ncbi:MerR family transcriptional regulator [Cellvibrio zantedeschiae]|uniref:MerR family transcriptional regulator n=1 Tax=Cellvibrio zantedeschiae TaxID=1237077 RepID=A0ABQ3B394_9GAMM|nr:MerR family transcriptional regulator [Cellvibrio zantedeschiae]GGY72066.1 MerR family transcriptional regulator [Cellvibrio zantedeschiae]
MNIKELSEKTHLSAHTLRYYEKIGILPNIQKNSSGHRFYSASDLEWISFVIKLKETGMPLEEIITYARLREQGDATSAERMQLLIKHREVLEAAIARQTNYLAALDAKINFYRNKINA